MPACMPGLLADVSGEPEQLLMPRLPLLLQGDPSPPASNDEGYMQNGLPLHTRTRCHYRCPLALPV